MIKEILKDLRCSTSWKRRFKALQTIKDYDLNDPKNKPLKDVVIELTISDKISKVKEVSLKLCQKNKLTKGKKPLFLGKKDIGYTNKDFNKTFSKIKKDNNMENFDLDVFKSHFLTINPEMYDVMEFEKSSKFDSWIENIYKSLRKH